MARLVWFAAALPVPILGVDVYVEGLGPVMMFGEDLEVLSQYLTHARTFFEFGMGASTLHIAREYRNLDKIVSVDMDRRWVSRVRQHPWLRNGTLPTQVKLLHAYIGRTVGFGFPLQNMSRCRHRFRLCFASEP